jgi:aspartate kinase
MLVMKFGGTSVGSAEAIARAGQIVSSRLPQSPVVVVSAVGHVTDLLVDIGRHAARQDRIKAYDLILTLLKKHRTLLQELELHEVAELRVLLTQVEEQLKKLCEVILQAGHMARHISDELLSLGEFLSAHLFSRYLCSRSIHAMMVDSREVMITDSRFGQAQPQLEQSRPLAVKWIMPLLQRGVVPVLQGFVGRDGQGRTTTLGRGGSDWSATLLGAMLNAPAVEIWTDVDGVLTADPSLVTEARRIRVMTFQEAAELAYFGAKVLHPATLLPAVEKNIPVTVLNSKRPAESGTLIAPAALNMENRRCVVKSIAYKENIHIITVTSTRMLMAYGFLSSIFEVFNRYQTAVDLVTTSEVSVSITIDHADRLTEIKRDLNHFAQVEVQSGKAIICLVGEWMRQTAGMPGEIFALLHDVPVHLISQGASEINISFVIDEEQLPDVIHRLHDHFFSGALDPDIFFTE